MADATEQIQPLKKRKQNDQVKMDAIEEDLVQTRLVHSKRFAGLSSQWSQTFLQAPPPKSTEANRGFDQALHDFHAACTAAIQEAEGQQLEKPGKMDTSTAVAAAESSACDDMPAPAPRTDIRPKQIATILLQAWRRRELFNERERSRMGVAVGQTVDLLLALHSHDVEAAVDALWALQDAEKQTIHELELVEKSAAGGTWGGQAVDTPPSWLHAQLLEAGLAEAFQCDDADKSLFCCQSVMDGIPDEAQDEWLSAFQPPTREQAADKLKALVAAQTTKESIEATNSDNVGDCAAQSVPKRRRTGQAEDDAGDADSEDKSA